MKHSSRLRYFLWSAVLLGLASVVILPCVLSAGVYYQVHFRHVRANLHWQTRQPNHYIYTLSFQGSVTYQTYQVEVLGGKLVKLTDLNTGVSLNAPGSVSSSFTPINAWVSNNLLINDMFIHIQTAIRPPNSVQAFISRANPAFYNRLSSAGWVRRGIVSCDPAYPQVVYHPVYGYPEDLFLSGDPCASLMEYSYPVHLEIEAFQVLP